MTDDTRADEGADHFHEVAAIFPMMAGDEFDGLVADIAKNGLIEPIWLYEGLVVDGRNRWLACKAAGVEPRYRTWDSSIGDGSLAGFVLSLNKHRRHLTPGQKAAAAYRSLPYFEKEGIAAKAAAGAKASPGKPAVKEKDGADRPHLSDPVEEPKGRAPRSRDKAAAAVGTSGRSVARFKRIQDNDPTLAAKVEAGEISLDRAERIIRDREAEARRIEEAKRQASTIHIGTTIDVRDGDFRDVLSDLTNVDAIITDPPYPREFIPLMDDLGRLAARILKPDGVLVVLMGQSYLPDVYRMLGDHLDYRWTGCYLTPGAGYSSHQRRVQSNWKPLLVYGNGPRFSDVFRSEGSDANAKNNHKWGQDYSAFQQIVKRFTAAGETVVDPFAGSGTTLLAAKALGRHAIGCDLDPDSVRTARERVA
jgi:16S rRNA G966 N2-methylase RsmD